MTQAVEPPTIVVGVDGTTDSRAAIRLAAQEACYREAGQGEAGQGEHA